MSYYRKKPVVIEALQWDGSWDSMDTINARWPEMRTTHLSAHPPSRTVRQWGIGTPEGRHQVSVGDFIIKGVKGEFYPCKPDIFALTYEEAESQGEQASAVNQGLLEALKAVTTAVDAVAYGAALHVARAAISAAEAANAPGAK